MSDEPGPGVEDARYGRQPRRPIPLGPPAGATDAEALLPGTPERPARKPATATAVTVTGARWGSPVDIAALRQGPIDRALARYLSSLPHHVYDAAALEGNPFTLPEVQTLIDGITVGGHRLADQAQVQALIEANRMLAELVRAGTFRLDKATSDRLHHAVARHEAIEAGGFRGEGTVGGGGTVRMGDLPDYRATPTEAGGANLRSQHDILLEQLEHLHPVERAMGYVVGATRGQFYVDGNKRTARLLMNGVLMSHGYDAISIPNRRRLEWNVHLRTLFASGEADGMLAFLLDCAPDP